MAVKRHKKVAKPSKHRKESVTEEEEQEFPDVPDSDMGEATVEDEEDDW